MSFKLQVDVYNCDECQIAFCVEKDIDPEQCPSCGSEFFEYSHSGFVVMDEAGSENNE